MRRYSIILILLFSTVANSQQVTFKREVIFQSVGGGRLVRQSRVAYDDRGREIETILYKSGSIKGVSDKDLEKFIADAERQKAKPRVGVSMLVRHYGFNTFGSTVEVKDIWDVHWPVGSNVRVFFSRDFDSERSTLIAAMDAWNAFELGVRFIYAGAAEETQMCQPCLTVIRNPSLGTTGRLYPGVRDGLIFTARIELGNADPKTLYTMMAHELGHSLGLPHSEEGLMRAEVRRGQMLRPSPTDVEFVRNLLR